MDMHSEKIRKKYNRAARFYDILETPMEMMALREWRIDLMKGLEGNILEIGVGTGKNIEYYPDDISITAIDFSEGMLQKAREKAEKYNKNVTLIQMDAQDMKFPDNTFDTIFTTCVYCSVPDPVKGLKEMRRVCKPNGKIIMIEHVRSEMWLLGAVMDILNPIVVTTYGANINRKTVENIYKSGFTDVNSNNLYGDIVKKIVIINKK
ncbi:class I SAM-dependent methyltransferase [Clostridium butyricum]|jgi:ubiquinone/menaquinone biosynthesis C-methylase UbiE|uniref:Methyltransferase domain-containing protein n=1 Tax=Clostridium butyricum TaxID=1492 RepID=A0A512TR41_CLOBU|nr:class I SAM-dependent methyltransferase [Clostridium butyricum]ETI91219.1 MAG: Methyltransferase type 11 [Clostridium butyricum DORA_1]MDU1509569.1 methyltransferase domain-containing protein [Clostridium butyricum]MDU4802368.1 methyltransferase domain-containing protein [Clostridium butyricum]NAS18816.1 methyltransferase domain-containing protein [Clostridium butyricum]NOW22489.1 ubiquinone/menaquinone biosynthesis C-methylase UbiE [Clostridium butyricum]